MFWHAPAENLNKPVETQVDLTSLPEANQDDMQNGLVAVVEHSASSPEDVTASTQMHSTHLAKHDWLHKLVPGIEKLAAGHHFGNFVVDRETGQRFFESMPIYARIGMHLLFYGKARESILNAKSVENILKAQSVKQGKIFDSPDSAKSIPSFVKTYNLDLGELLYPDLGEYKCFNEFFYRKLKPGARQVQNASNPRGICSAADCRLTVYPTVALAKKFWVKGDEFTIPHLLNVEENSSLAQEFRDCSLAIFRLAPADYHRFHCPVDGVTGEIVNIDGQYYTVNPQAVNEVDFDVFTANIRSVLYLTHTVTQKKVAFVAIGAMLVGSIAWTNGGTKGATVKRGEELGYFAYGGSTIIALFPKGVVEFDTDLVKNSEEPIETLVKVGSSIGTSPA